MTATDPYAALDAEETRLVTQLAEVRSAKATLRRVLGIAEPPHGPTGVAEPVPRNPPCLECGRPLSEHAAGLACPAQPAETPPGKPDARPATPKAGEAKGSPARLARLLAEKGPLRASEAGPLLGLPPCVVSQNLTGNPDLFEKQPGNIRSPWGLTPAGRTLAAG